MSIASFLSGRCTSGDLYTEPYWILAALGLTPGLWSTKISSGPLTALPTLPEACCHDWGGAPAPSVQGWRIPALLTHYNRMSAVAGPPSRLMGQTCSVFLLISHLDNREWSSDFIPVQKFKWREAGGGLWQFSVCEKEIWSKPSVSPSVWRWYDVALRHLTPNNWYMCFSRVDMKFVPWSVNISREKVILETWKSIRVLCGVNCYDQQVTVPCLTPFNRADSVHPQMFRWGTSDGWW